MKMRSSTEKKSIEPDFNINKGDNVLAKTFSYKRQISKRINLKRALKINNGAKLKRKKNSLKNLLIKF